MRPVAVLWAALLVWPACLDTTTDHTLLVTIEDDGVFYADNISHREVQVALPADTSPGQELVVTTTLGIVNHSGAGAEQTRTLYTPHARDDEPFGFKLYAGTVSGPGEVRVEARGLGLSGFATFTLAPADDELTVDVAPGPYLADGVSPVALTVTRTSPLTDRATVTVKTSHGVLDPAATGDPQKQIVLGLRGGDSADLILQAGREPGQAIVTAALPDGLPRSAAVVLEHAPPTLLALVLDQAPILDAARKRIDITAPFAREPGQGRPSLGTRIHFQTCCDGRSALGDCGEYLSIPPFATASSADQVQVALRLTAAGESFVAEQGDPPADDLDAAIHAYALEADASETAPTCADLDAGQLLGVAAAARADIVLRKAPTP